LNPKLSYRYRDRYDALRASGVVECVVSGRGPAASDGEEGSLYHYLRIEVRPDKLIVRPIGIRRLAEGYRREAPMPAFHIIDLPEGRAPWEARVLDRVEIVKDRAATAIWV
jgi:hypothetical protein